MDGKRLKAQDEILRAIKDNKNFVLQGGAGSGKTETLKKVIHTISKEYSTKKIACITYTNLAADEIKERVGSDYTICTIHSFLNHLIKNYKKNLHQVIAELFIVPKIVRQDISYYSDQKEQNKKEHDNYKRIHEKYSKMNWTVNKKPNVKVVGKRDYDKSPEEYNENLNDLTEVLNKLIINEIEKKDFNEIQYNETQFNNFNKISFGHDGLLKIAVLLLKKYPLLIQIVQDKYDFIFIDEYQDTDKDLIEVFIKSIGKAGAKNIVGLFGDSMQGIYEDGIGDVEDYISRKELVKINKDDNYRSSIQVINFANKYRNDGIIQKVALKKGQANKDREGIVKLYYAIYTKDKPTRGSRSVDKDEYLKTLFELIQKVEMTNSEFKKLMLTNKAISGKLDFKNLFNVFNLITQDINEKIKKDFDNLQLNELADLCNDYKNKNFNSVLTKVKKSGFKLKTIDDKDKLSKLLENFLDPKIDCLDALEEAFVNNLIKKSNSHDYYIALKDSFLLELKKDKEYQIFKLNYTNGENTFAKMKKVDDKIEQEIFISLERKHKKDEFYLELFINKKITFNEILNYRKYIDGETDYITMHKTKGSGIPNVLIVLDEFFRIKYNFSCIFDKAETDNEKQLKNQKLFYVACSRAIDNLICVKLIQKSEENNLVGLFPESEKIIL